jgi:hypothetical protein
MLKLMQILVVNNDFIKAGKPSSKLVQGYESDKENAQ